MEFVGLVPLEDGLEIGKQHDRRRIVPLGGGGGFRYLARPLGPITSGKIGYG